MRLSLFTLSCLLSVIAVAQVVDRYNVIQKPTETSATVAWRTATSSIGTINWGTDPQSLSNTMSVATATKKHFYELTGLTPNTKYYYQTSTDGGFLSDVDYFYTAKPDTVRNLSFLHYGDCGYDNSVQNDIAALMIEDSTEFGIVAGDIDQGFGDNYDNVFFGPYQDLLKNACQYTAIGNHDTYADNAATYLDDFYMPTNNPQQSERYYSFTWGNAKFICLDSNIPYQIGSDQHNWMLDELKCNDRQWVYVFFHHPPWTNAWSPDYYVPFTEYFMYQGNEDMRTDLVPYFEQYNVDFVLNGHSHCYQRGELNGVKYIISGGAGASSLDFNTNSNAPNIDTEIYVNQYVRFHVNGDTATYIAIDIDDNVIDSVTTIKPFVPIKPIISFNGTELASTSGDTYTWFLDGIQISGATSQTHLPLAEGVYEVMTTNAHGCTFMSDPFEYIINGLGENVFSSVELYPNPTSGNLNLKSALANFQGDLTITVLNTQGQVILTQDKTIENGLDCQLELPMLDAGVYFVEIGNSLFGTTKKFVVE
jgi:hypothetical protein